MSDSLQALRDALRDFARARDWQRHHNPKNLAMALIVEAAELVELFQWRTAEESQRLAHGEGREAVSDELADVLIYLVELADVMEIDLLEAARAKLVKNARKYPACAQGDAEKSQPL